MCAAAAFVSKVTRAAGAASFSVVEAMVRWLMALLVCGVVVFFAGQAVAAVSVLLGLKGFTLNEV